MSRLYLAPRMTGFTLTEMMIVLLLAAVFISLAAPGFRSILERTRLQTTTSNITTSLMLARSEALKRNQSISVCKKTTTNDGCLSGTVGNWDGGWIVHLDPNNPSSLDPNEIIRVGDALSGGDTLRLVDDPNDVTPTFYNSLLYRNDGGVSQAASFVVCNSNGDLDTGRLITMSLTGRPSNYTSVSKCHQ